MLARRVELEGHEVTDLPGNIIQEGPAKIEHFIQGIDKKPDIIINNFGINHLSWIGQTPPEDEAIIRANLLGPYWVINYAHKHGIGPCRVVNVASQTYRVAQRCTTLYCASKAGLVQMTKVMARELAGEGWVINAVAPGKIMDTEMSYLTDDQVVQLRGWAPSQADKYALSNIPAGRFTTRSEVSDAVMKVLTLPAYVNGTVIEIMGGV
jgi:NAD(P)-dependent dehydrogenase (short-subunit alcohol dehydrogenase family)